MVNITKLLEGYRSLLVSLDGGGHYRADQIAMVNAALAQGPPTMSPRPALCDAVAAVDNYLESLNKVAEDRNVEPVEIDVDYYETQRFRDGLEQALEDDTGLNKLDEGYNPMAEEIAAWQK